MQNFGIWNMGVGLKIKPAELLKEKQFCSIFQPPQKLALKIVVGKWSKIVPLLAALQALFSALHPRSIYQNFAFFIGKSKIEARVVRLAAISRKIRENPPKIQKMGFLTINTAVTGQPLPQN